MNRKKVCSLIIVMLVCSLVFATWTKEEEVDDFGDKTGKVTYFSGAMNGTYSSYSSGVSNGKLLWGWYINSDGTTQFLLQEGGKNANLSTAAYTTDKYTIKMKGSDGKTYAYTGQITRNGAYYNIITITNNLRSVLAMNTSFRVVISNDKGTYSLGSVDTSNCEGLFFDVSGYNSAKAMMQQGLYEQAIKAFNNLDDLTFNYFNCKDSVSLCNSEITASKLGIQKGQAGGYIFYDCDADNDKRNKGAGPDGLKSDVCGWRYLEAAPTDMMDTKGERIFYEWGDYGTFGTETGIGEGKKNTEIIVSKASKDRTNNAAKACLDYSVNGYDDWFLPSKDELNMMYENLKKNNLGGFSYYDGYWSSSEDYYDDYAWYQYFSDGGQDGYGRLGNKYVRAIRAF